MKTVEFLNSPIWFLLGQREAKGNLFGVELELEGQNVGLRDIATKGWTRNNEPSLRGEAIEFATAGGKTLEEAKALVVLLFKKFLEHKVVLKNSARTSTHVHLNFSDKTMKQAINFFSLFTVFEELLTNYSGENRKGNVFCLTSRDSEGIIGVLTDSIGSGHFNRFQKNQYKYGACNLSSLCKFGTVEIRTMRGADSSAQVNNWLDILNEMYEYSLKMKSPAELVSNLSLLGSDGLLRTVFSPKNVDELLSTLPKDRRLYDSLMEGARLIQVLAFQFEAEFQEQFELPKMEKNKKGGLPLKIQKGVYKGHPYSVYLLDGRRWSLYSPRMDVPGEDQFWRDGERVGDEPRISWSARRGRFIWTDWLGDETPLNWSMHDEILNEGAPLRGRGIRDDMIVIPHEEVEEAMEEHFDEGDDW